MNTEDQKAKEQTKPTLVQTFSSTGNAYNDLKSLYNMVKDNIEIYSSKSGRDALSKELDDFKNRLFTFLSNQKVSHNELENIKNRLEYLFYVIKGRDLNELNLHRNELNDAFDFDLGEQKPINGYNEIKAFYQQCENLKTSPKKEKKKPEFEDFFKDLSDDQIKAIHQKYIDCNAKGLAILIDLLHHKYKVLKLKRGDNFFSKKNFIEFFENPTYQGVNDYFKKYIPENCVYNGYDDDKFNIESDLNNLIKTT